MKLVLFELEGCIFDVDDFWMEVHKVYGTMREGKILTQRYQKTNNARLVDLVVNGFWKKRNSSYYLSLISNIKYVDGVRENFSKIKDLGFKTAIITDAPHELAKKAKADLEIDSMLNNMIGINSDGRLSGEYVWTVSPDNKLEHLQEICSKENINMADVIFVGRKNADVKIANNVGFSIAFRSNDAELKNSCSAVVDGNFSNLVEEIKKHI